MHVCADIFGTTVQVRMMLQTDAFRARLQGEAQEKRLEPGEMFETLQCFAFWNQTKGVRSQRWDAFAALANAHALRQQAAHAAYRSLRGPLRGFSPLV